MTQRYILFRLPGRIFLLNLQRAGGLSVLSLMLALLGQPLETVYLVLLRYNSCYRIQYYLTNYIQYGAHLVGCSILMYEKFGGSFCEIK